MDMTVTMIPWNDDSAFLVSLRDVSARVEAEQARKKSHDLLETRVRERTMELSDANEKLRKEIAERMRSEDALKASEELFRTLFESAGDGIFVKDRRLRYTRVNPSMENQLAIPASQIIGRTDKEIFGPEAGAHLMEVDSRALEGAVIEEENTRIVGGSPVTLLEIRSPLRNGGGEIIGVFGISHNITDRKRVEPSLPVTPGKEYPSRAMRETMKMVRLAAQSDSTLLLLGESGSGKDYLAAEIHKRSARSSGPFFSINCAAVAKDLAESELFGHEAGAFTGAKRSKRGLLELAEGGTLLLNEIGELSQALQAKLLTFLDKRSFTRVGGEKEIFVSAGLITATNRDLQKEVSEGRFREDLFYRLNVFPIRVPPLRERLEDLPMLVDEIIAQLAAAQQTAITPSTPSEALDAMRAYSWPGNVRELRNVLERALILSRGGPVTVRSLGLEAPADDPPPVRLSLPEGQTLNDAVWELKRRLVREAFSHCRGNKTRAAKLLGISRCSVINYMKAMDDDQTPDT